MLYLGLYNLAKGNRTSPLLSIPGNRSQHYIYAFIVYQSGQLCSTQVYFIQPKGAEPGPYYLSWGSRSQRYIYAFIVHQRKHSCSTQAFFIQPSGAEPGRYYLSWGANLNALCLYHLSWGSRSHTIQTIKPIIKAKVTRLLRPTISTTTPNFRNPRNPQKNAQKISTARSKHEQISNSVPYQSRYYSSQGSRS